MKYLIGFLALLGASCCTPYATPSVTPEVSYFGVKHYLESSPDKKIRMVFTHGMCSENHTAVGEGNWVGTRAKLISQALGGEYTAADLYAPTESYPKNQPISGSVQRYDVSIPSPRGTVEATFLIWGTHVDKYRANLNYENGRRTTKTPDEPVRAVFNALGKKELMNKCLIDAVVYIGDNGDPIRSNMREALCGVVGGKFQPANPTGDRSISAKCLDPKKSGIPTVLVPQSLGSSVMFDAFNRLDDGVGNQKMKLALKDVRSIYLVSNQLSFLDQANVSADSRLQVTSGNLGGSGSLGLFLSRLDNQVNRLTENAGVQIINFSDPNDLLSYRINLKEFGEDFPGYDARNVLVSNATTYLDLFSNPGKAHTGTASEKVFGLIANGYDAN